MNSSGAAGEDGTTNYGGNILCSGTDNGADKPNCLSTNQEIPSTYNITETADEKDTNLVLRGQEDQDCVRKTYCALVHLLYILTPLTRVYAVMMRM